MAPLEHANETPSIQRYPGDAKDTQTDEPKIGPCPMLWLTKRPPSENHTDDESDERPNLGDGETENYNYRLAKARLLWSAGQKDHCGNHQPQERVYAPGPKQNPTRQSH